MGPEFITRVKKMTAGLAMLAALFVAAHVAPSKAAAVLAGAAWAVANVALLGRLARVIVEPAGLRVRSLVWLLAVKFPALYGAGYALLAWARVDPYWALAGFSLLPAVLFLKALGRALIWSGAFNPCPAGRHVGVPALVSAGRRRPGKHTRTAALLAVVFTLGIIGAIAAGVGSGAPHAEETGAPPAAHDAAVADGAHGEPAAEHGGATHEEAANELPNAITVLYAFFGHSPVVRFLHHWENIVFSILIALLLVVLFRAGIRRRDLVPGRFQAAVELAVESLANFIEGILGPRGREFVPFLGTLFLYILAMNLAGLVPGLKSPTANLNVTAGLAATVFLYVQYTGIRKNGIGGYLYHLMGSPKGITWAMVPLNIPLHIIEELARPMSLALRLFGNITGEDVLIFIFAGLGVASLSFLHAPVGLPLQVPFLFLAILTSTIQALVFTLLSTIYFSLMLPHGEESPEHH
jgi:F-type H+-transporting ATPase subunit a